MADIVASEAHLPAARRSVTLVTWLRGRERKLSLSGWIIFVGFIVLNEVRGVYVVVEFLKAWNS